MADDTFGDGVEVLNMLFRQAAIKHGNNVDAVLAEVRQGVDDLDAPEKEAALKALDMALQPSAQRH